MFDHLNAAFASDGALLGFAHLAELAIRKGRIGAHSGKVGLIAHSVPCVPADGKLTMHEMYACFVLHELVSLLRHPYCNFPIR